MYINLSVQSIREHGNIQSLHGPQEMSRPRLNLWDFYHDSRDRWSWRSITLDRVRGSERVFFSLCECLADAEAEGFDEAGAACTVSTIAAQPISTLYM